MHYSPNASYTACDPGTQTVNCTGLPPETPQEKAAWWNGTGTVFQTWTGTAWSPSEAGVFSKDPTAIPCRYKLYKNLTVDKSGSGGGTVISNPAGIDCGADCSEKYLLDSQVTLTAEPQANSSFMGWFKVAGGSYPNCSGGNPACKVIMDDAKTIVAKFMLNATLTIIKTGAPGATVYEDYIRPIPYDTINAVPIDCGGVCAKIFRFGNTAELEMKNLPKCSKLKSIKDCATLDTPSNCHVLMDADKTVTFDFETIKYKLTTYGKGNGAGTLTFNPLNETCDLANNTNCTKMLDCDSTVTLTATPAAGSHFERWTDFVFGTPPLTITSPNNCADTASRQCSFKMENDDYQTAIFCMDNYSWDGNNCVANACPANPPPYGQLCIDDGKDVPGGTANSLVAACVTNTTKCEYACDAAHHLENGACAINTYPLTVTLSGNGSGKAVNTTPAAAGIDCGSGGTDCTENYSHGAAITLKATAGPSSTFSGWSGDCDGTGSCAVTMDAVKTVTAAFALKTFTITATAGAKGTVTPAGVTTKDYGTEQEYIITPSTGYHIASVLADGVSAGAVAKYTFSNITANHTISASFAIDTYTVTATVSTGSVTGALDPTSKSVSYGGTATFTVSPNTGYRIDSVSGCGGTLSGTTYTTGAITADCTVSATFNPILTVIKSGIGAADGTVNVTTPATPILLWVGNTGAAAYDFNTTVTLSAVASANTIFTGWTVNNSTAVCPGTGDCSITMDGAKKVIATFHSIATCTYPSGLGGAGYLANSATSITQTAVNKPSSVYSYNTSPSALECRFTCDAGYIWNSTQCVAFNWISGPCPGISVASMDLPNGWAWQTSDRHCVAPQCATGIDTLSPTFYSLVADNNVDFSSYPARNACKALGGRLPTSFELLCIADNSGWNTLPNAYGSSFFNSIYPTSTEVYNIYIWYVPMKIPTSGNRYLYSMKSTPPNAGPVRCVK